jgi:hypothetical protein
MASEAWSSLLNTKRALIVGFGGMRCGNFPSLNFCQNSANGREGENKKLFKTFALAPRQFKWNQFGRLMGREKQTKSIIIAI